MSSNAITRILPHTETTDWTIADYQPTDLNWTDSNRTLRVTIGLRSGSGFSISCRLQRKKVPRGVGRIERTLQNRERQICQAIADRISQFFAQPDLPAPDVISAVGNIFDELVVSRHLMEHHGLGLNPERIFRSFHELAEQTYENKSLTFACILDSSSGAVPDVDAKFPESFLSEKRFRALSDGYNTSYLISKAGKLIKFRDLSASRASSAPRAFFPEWCGDLAGQCRGRKIGIALTRQGDILVIDDGTLRFTYRFGQWQFWNHTHLTDLLRNLARVQRVPTATIPKVVHAIYRASLDISFRRSGGLFVVLRNRRTLSKLVRESDQLGNRSRSALNNEFDRALPFMRIQDLPRSVLVELAALDGAVVVSNQGDLLAYGAVLATTSRKRSDAEDGSRTKAAISASKYGLAVKVSADSDIIVYNDGAKFIQV